MLSDEDPENTSRFANGLRRLPDDAREKHRQKCEEKRDREKGNVRASDEEAA